LLAAPVTSLWAAHRADAQQAIAQALSAREKALAAGVTSETGALIEEAQDLIPSRQYTKAVELAERARKQDEYALAQAAAAKPAATAAAATAAPASTTAAPPAATAAPAAAAVTNSFSAAEAETAIAAAEAARKKADSVGGEWRDTAKMIKDAEEQLKTGQFDAAVKLANKAKQQGELGYAQAISQKGATFPSYVHAKP
jgi:hypothetical protein